MTSSSHSLSTNPNWAAIHGLCVSVSFDPAGEYLMAATQRNGIHFFPCGVELSHHEAFPVAPNNFLLTTADEVSCGKMTSSSTFALGGVDGRVRWVDAKAGGKTLFEYKLHKKKESPVLAVGILPTGSLLSVTRRSCNIVDPRAKEVVSRIESQRKEPFSTGCWMPHTNNVVVPSPSRVLVYDLRETSKPKLIIKAYDAVSSVTGLQTRRGAAVCGSTTGRLFILRTITTPSCVPEESVSLSATLKTRSAVCTLSECRNGVVAAGTAQASVVFMPLGTSSEAKMKKAEWPSHRVLSTATTDPDLCQGEQLFATSYIHRDLLATGSQQGMVSKVCLGIVPPA